MIEDKDMIEVNLNSKLMHLQDEINDLRLREASHCITKSYSINDLKERELAESKLNNHQKYATIGGIKKTSNKMLDNPNISCLRQMYCPDCHQRLDAESVRFETLLSCGTQSICIFCLKSFHFLLLLFPFKMPQIEEMIDVNLDSPNTPEDHHQHSPAFKKCITFNKNVDNIQYEGQDTTDFVTSPQKLRSWSTLSDKDDDKPHLRYFSVGPSTHQLRCPLCKQRADAETVQMSGILGQLSCLLSSFSCCFPIFSLSLVYMCLQSRLKSKRLFCNNCGGHLGFYWRPT